MKKKLQVYLRSLLLSGMFLMTGAGAYANHISAMDLAYTFVSSTGSGATLSSVYLVTVTIYGNCSDTTGSFPTLPESVPQVCVFNGTAAVATLNLALQGTGVNVTNVCPADTGLTTCSSLSNTIPGNERYIYTATVTLTGTSQYFRFIYTGYNGTAGAEAGRSNQITTIVDPSSSLVHLIDTLNNTDGSNTSTTLPIIPTPYYCAGDPDNYNPGATNADGDSLVFQSVTPLVGSATCSSTTGTNVDYDAGISAAAPVSGATAYSFNSTNGQISFTTTTLQTTVVDYNIREFRSGVLVGTCQREMNISVQTCTTPAPTGTIRTPSDGAVTSDSTTFETCENSGVFSFTVVGQETDTNYAITMVASNIPVGATYSIANDSTNHPVATFTWTSTGTAPGTYTFDILFASSSCPVQSTGTEAINVIVEPLPSAITGTTTVCTGESTTLADALTGGTWSSSNTSVATAGSSSGTIYGVSSDLDTITYSYSAAACNVTTTVNVTGPKAITGTLTVCPTLTTDLAETVTGGVWTSSNTAVATVGTSGVVTGVVGGTANITYTITSSGCFVIAPVTVTALAAISPASSVVCIDNTVTLTDATSGGIWSSSSTTIATVASGGIVHGVASGSVDIFYTVGSCYATAVVSVSATGPAAITTPSGGATTCVGSTIALTDASTGGTWSSSTTGVATVNSTSGVVTGVAAGAATISYFLGGCYVVIPVTIITGIAAITPATSEICIANTENLTETTTGGVWSSLTTTVATVSSTGTVGGVAAGTTTISYSIGTCSALATVTVSAGPVAITPVPVTICQGTTADLTDATPGGTWSSNNSTVASVVGGTVTGATTGTATISYTQAGCPATTVVTVVETPAAILPASALICTGNTATLTESVTGGAWSSGNTAVASVTSGVVTGIGVGTTTISYESGTCLVTAIVTVDLAPDPGLITGPTVVCIGGTSDLTDAVSDGVWSSSNTAAATVNTSGVVSGVATGTTTISYSLIAACGTVPTTHVVSVDVAPTAGTITGSASVCAGTTDLLSDATTGGTWSASNTHATVSSTSGLVTGVAAGLDTIKYTITSSCGTVSTTMAVTVGAFLSAGTITGTVNSICAGATLSVADATTGGTWSSSNASATVNTSGLVTGATVGGLDTIEYTVTSSCGAAVATYPITVNAIPDAAPVVGSSVLCVGSSALFTDASAGGVWSSSNVANATVTSGGLVTGAALGTATIAYTISNSCGTSVATATVTMSATVTAGTISGPASVCIGSTIPLVDAAGSGVWSSSNTSAEVAGGIVTGLVAGTDTIYYTVTTGCGTAVASQVITVNSSVSSAGTILGPSAVCVSSLISLTNPTASGGDWSSSNSHATITTGGSVTGISPGTDTISYTITSTCGIASATKIITITALSSVGAISGSSVICVGVATTFTDATTGGVWSSLDGNASVGSSSGLVTGISAGADVISYTVTTACGSLGTTMAITISGSATAGSITGPDSVCVGANITLTDAVSGGVWSSGNANVALIGGDVTGVAAGTSPISYTVTNSCGTVVAVDIITISPSPSAGTISGSSTVCAGASITLTDVATGGIWLSSNPSASVAGAGIIEGVSGGVDTIFYEVTNSCGTRIASKVISIHGAPAVDAIVGPTHQCTGASSDILLLDATTGGVWTSSNTTVATIDDVTGVITGLGIGTATLSYTVSNGFGCSTWATSLDTVMATPALAPISGSSAVCIGSTTMLSDVSTGGAWSSSDAATATINPVSGVVGGISIGTVVISYSVVNSCGTSFVVMAEAVDAMPTIASISGPVTICAGSVGTLADATTGGTWSSANTAVATADPSSGAITGVSPGTSTIDYNYSGTCPVTLGIVITVVTGPAIDAITGTTSECIGTSASLTDGTPLGVWSSSNTAIATVSTGGSVTGVAPGTVTILYTVTSGVACAVSAATADTVLGIPAESPITGAAPVCAGANLLLSNASPDGSWRSANTAIAVINALTGEVTGVSGGTDKIYYTISDICGSALDSVTITVNAAPTVAPIGAAFTTLCSGTTVTLTETGTSGGVWVSSNTTIATVGSTGVVTGIAGGTDTVRYTATNADGCSNSAMISLNISGSVLAAAISPSGSLTLCHGHTVDMDVAGASAGTTYQWLLDGGAITGATNSSYTATSVGVYSAAIDNGTCSETVHGPTVIAPPDPIILFSIPATLYTGSFPSYQWFLNGVLIPGADASSIIIDGAGTYQVVVTDNNHCSDTSGGYIVTGGGINGVNTAATPLGIKVYPNPATSMLSIDAPLIVNVSILSIDGKVVISKNAATSIDVSALADGMYMVMVYDQNNLLLKVTKFTKVQ